MIKIICDGCWKAFKYGEQYTKVYVSYCNHDETLHFHTGCAYTVESAMSSLFAKERSEVREENQ